MTIERLLVANRGEIARRVLRTARAMGIPTVAVYVDADGAAPFVTDADEAIRLPTTYLDGPAIIAAAQRTGATAIHPGYGFLSENASFAGAVTEAGLIWVGPPPAAIAAMGDKLSAKSRAAALGVPTLQHATDPADADRVGYPLLIKASAGGGGKGMRVVTGPSGLADAVTAARREAAGAFGDDTLFLERYVERSRHVEIQILGDAHGTLVHLGERECSIQRRHQKVVEESPSPIVTASLRAAMGEAALTLARAIEYQSAGTVEFLVDDATREFFFLEVNTRLQVEHPVTEEVTGLDLVREQLRIADGEPLGYDQSDVVARGHAIEVRLCAEDPAHGYLPATGTLAAFAPADEPVVRWESGVVAGSVVGVSFDPLLAKVIAHAPTRAEAAGRLALALERLHLGGVTTNRDLLAATLRDEAFLAGDTTTKFLEERPLNLAVRPEELQDALRTGALWLMGERRRSAPVLGSLPSGWRNARLPAQHTTLRHQGVNYELEYRMTRGGDVHFSDGAVATVHQQTADAIDLEIDGRRRHRRVTTASDDLFVQTGRTTVHLSVVAPFAPPEIVEAAGTLSAPMPGTVLEVRVDQGDYVTKGATLVVLEAMKMEHHITAPTDGTITELFVAPGQQVANGEMLLVLEAPDG